MLKQEQEDLLKAQRRLEQAVSFHSEIVLIRLFLWRLFGVKINKEIQRVKFHGQIFLAVYFVHFTSPQFMWLIEDCVI